MSAILVKIPPAIRSAAAPRDSPIANPMKQGPAYAPGTNSRMQHQEQLDGDQQHPDAHARFQRDRIARVGLALERGEGGPGVRERVHADAEPRDSVASGDPDEAEQEDDQRAAEGELLQEEEVDEDDGPDEQLEDHQELALLDQVGLAGLVDQLRDLPHRLVDGHVLQLRVDHQPEAKAQRGDHEADHEQRAPVGAFEEGHGAEIGQLKVGLAALVNDRSAAGVLLRRRRHRRDEHERRQRQRNQGRKPPQPSIREHVHLSPRLAPSHNAPPVRGRHRVLEGLAARRLADASAPNAPVRIPRFPPVGKDGKPRVYTSDRGVLSTPRGSTASPARGEV